MQKKLHSGPMVSVAHVVLTMDIGVLSSIFSLSSSYFLIISVIKGSMLFTSYIISF